MVLAGALFSMALNPLLFRAIAPLQDWLRARSAWARRLEQRDDPLAELPTTTDSRYLARQVVLVGYGRVGRRVAATLAANDIPFVLRSRTGSWWRPCGPMAWPPCLATRWSAPC